MLDVSLGLAVSVNDCVTVDGDGCAITPERHGKGYRLTLPGYHALTAFSPERFPEAERRDSQTRAIIESALQDRLRAAASKPWIRSSGGSL